MFRNPGGILWALAFLALAMILMSGCTSRQRLGVGIVTGVVLSTSGNPVYEASIVVQNTGRTAVTDWDGSFSITNVPAGQHGLQVTKQGYQPGTITVEVKANRVALASGTLTPNPDSVRIMGVIAFEH